MFFSSFMYMLNMVVALEIWLLVSMFIFSLQTQVLVISQNLACDSDDLVGLTGFMNGLDSPINEWRLANASSLSSSNCCNWVGITCDSSSGRIVRLELPNKILSGKLSDSIFKLNQLRRLNLSHNSLKGPLPVSVFHLAYLEEVDLSGNYFDEGLPASVNLPALEVLDVSDNKLRGSLPYGLCVNSSRIRVLSFRVNYITGIIPHQFENCNSLEHLSVAANYISGVIPDFLFRLPRLRELDLRDNEFTALSGLSSNFTSGLVRLDISFNRISGNLPDFFHCFPNLNYFSVHSNNLTGVVPLSLTNSKTISTLNLGNNSFDGSIEFNCSMLVNLTSLDLGSNNFSGTLPANLASCQKLKALNLARNKLTGQIPESFKNFQSLSYLSISNCSFTNISISLNILQHCPNLTVLVLTMNYYTEQLPSDDDLQFKSLKALIIANCRLRGGIPSWLKGLKLLQLLDLSYNQLTGSIPSYFGDFKFLFYLDLSNNSLSGEIPKSLTRLQRLISINSALEDPSPDFPFFKNKNISCRRLPLQYNQIMKFPPQLDLSRNHLTGPIWPEFGSLKKLHVLDLGHNNLSGTIPTSLSGMTSIEALDLSYNSLTGIIPSSLVRLSFLSKFSVAYNNLTGIIPSGSQFWTFPNSSFEGNRGLCGNFFVNCPKNQDLLPPPTASDKDKDFSIFRMLVIIGFGTGFLLTVIPLLAVPGIRGAY